MSLPTFLGFWAASVAVGIAACAFFVLRTERVSTPMWIVLAIVLAVFTYAPHFSVRRRARRRQKRVIRSLPDTLDLLVTGIEAGLGVDAAIAMVTERTTGPLADALTLYLRQVGLGQGRGAALEYVSARSGAPDLIRLSKSITQAEVMGSTLGDVLRAQAEELRVVRRQRAQEAAQKAPVKMTIPLVLFFLPAMGLVVLVPSLLNLVRFITGLGNGE
jgi:tight adherence protein C